jgi:hypothetical protein
MVRTNDWAVDGVGKKVECTQGSSLLMCRIILTERERERERARAREGWEGGRVSMQRNEKNPLLIREGFTALYFRHTTKQMSRSNVPGLIWEMFTKFSQSVILIK